MPPFQLHSPGSIEEAFEIASNLGEAGREFDWVAGGTDLLPNYKWHLNSKSDVISLALVSELNILTETHIGAMVRLHDLAESEKTHAIVRKAAESVASTLIRRSATVGGNLCLDTRCFWFNQTEDWRESIDWCHKCDCGTEADCRVIPNQNTLCDIPSRSSTITDVPGSHDSPSIEERPEIDAYGRLLPVGRYDEERSGGRGDRDSRHLAR